MTKRKQRYFTIFDKINNILESAFSSKITVKDLGFDTHVKCDPFSTREALYNEISNYEES